MIIAIIVDVGFIVGRYKQLDREKSVSVRQYKTMYRINPGGRARLHVTRAYVSVM